jgi:hypothetical protein
MREGDCQQVLINPVHKLRAMRQMVSIHKSEFQADRIISICNACVVGRAKDCRGCMQKKTAAAEAAAG